MPWALEVSEGPNQGHRFTIPPGHTVVIGRTTLATQGLTEDPWMSSIHFTVGVSGGAPRFQNLSNTNGTEINGERVETAALKDGDQIKAGQSIFAVRAPEPSPFPSKASLGGWGFRSVPEGWIQSDAGFLLNAENSFKASLCAVEEPLPAGQTLDAYIKTQVDLAHTKIPTLSIEPPISIKIDGPEQAIALRMSLPIEEQPTVVQRQIYALSKGIVGILTVTISEAEPHREVIESVIRGLSYFQG